LLSIFQTWLRDRKFFNSKVTFEIRCNVIYGPKISTKFKNKYHVKDSVIELKFNSTYLSEIINGDFLGEVESKDSLGENISLFELLFLCHTLGIGNKFDIEIFNRCAKLILKNIKRSDEEKADFFSLFTKFYNRFLNKGDIIMKAGRSALPIKFDALMDDLKREGKWAEKLETAREMTLRGYPREEIIAILRVTPEEYIDIENEINPSAAQA
jgi:hypothetical protein